MPRLKRMMQVLILLILPFLAVGGSFEVCHEAEHHACSHRGISECGLRDVVRDCCSAPGTHCRHGHHHERILLLLDAGSRVRNDEVFSLVSVRSAGHDIADIGQRFLGSKAMLMQYPQRLQPAVCRQLMPLRC